MLLSSPSHYRQNIQRQSHHEVAHQAGLCVAAGDRWEAWPNEYEDGLEEGERRYERTQEGGERTQKGVSVALNLTPLNIMHNSQISYSS